MAHRNRVDPFGRLHAVAERGSLFGNRGCLHDAEGEIRRFFALERWIYCRLEFKGRRRELLQPNRYTELFFLDEATALAAGHRPCAECMRERYNDFRRHWPGDGNPRAPEIDAALQTARIDPAGRRVTWTATPAELPDGVFVVERDQPRLHMDGALLPWTFGGYGRPEPVAPDREVEVLTPRPAVEAIAAGFAPSVAR